MSVFFLSVILAGAVAAWSYTKLARANGNANPRSNVMAALGFGAVILIVVFSLARFVFHL